MSPGTDLRRAAAERLAEVSGTVDEGAVARHLPFVDAVLLLLFEDMRTATTRIPGDGQDADLTSRHLDELWRAMLHRYALDRRLPWPGEEGSRG